MQAADQLAEVRRELKTLFIERDALIDAALIAVLAGHHLLMLGPPGTAKSMLAQQVCRRIEGRTYFEWLLTKFTTPEELFGPISLAALEDGRYERITTGKLPEAEIVFVDEVFKASSAILNALLTVLNERRFYQGTRILDVPLISLFAASNELPEEDELAALYDRFLLRFVVGYVEQDHHFIDLLRMDDAPAGAPAVLQADALMQLQAQVREAIVPEGVLADIVEIRKRLMADGVIASDRRYRHALAVVRAAAVLDGRSAVQHADLVWLEHVLWNDPEERPKVVEVLSALASGFEEEARELLAHAREINGYARRPWPDSGAQSRAILEAHAKLDEITRSLDTMREGGRSRGRDTTALDEIRREISSLQQNLLPGRN